MLQVTWCTTKTRTSDPHRNPLSAPPRVPVASPPMIAGSTNVATVNSGNARSIHRSAPSATRSGVHSFGSDFSASRSHPMCECQSPISTPFAPAARARCGECGSPYLSANAWWRRCVAHQSITPPSTDSDPATARATRAGFTARKLRWVNRRW